MNSSPSKVNRMVMFPAYAGQDWAVGRLDLLWQSLGCDQDRVEAVRVARDEHLG